MSVTCSAASTKKKKGVRVVDGKEIPWNLFTAKAPLHAKVVANHRQPHTLTAPTGDANRETVHVTLEHGGQLPYIEGQCIGVIAPGPDKKGQIPAKLRQYSIASSAVGDDGTSSTVSLCVKRVVEVVGEHQTDSVRQGEPDTLGTEFCEDNVYRGVCSNFLCDLSVGEEVLVTGPTGAEMLLPEDDQANIIMIATGTGIAPMRGYLRKLFSDTAGVAADGSRRFKGLAWLFLGVPYSTSLLYNDEHVEYRMRFPDHFRYDYALSREESNAAGEKMYIQNKMAEYANELWKLMQQDNTHVYLCGLKGMEKGMDECFGALAEEAGSDWKTFSKAMKKQKRYHVETS